MKIKDRIHYFFFLREHPHIVSVVDMALGCKEPASIPVTAWKYRCVLCEMEIVEITETGIKQLEAGNEEKDVIKWMK